MTKRIIITLVAFVALQLHAKVTMPQLFQDGMVLQRAQPINVWGWADAGESVTVTLKGKNATAVADEQGRWSVQLPAQKAGGPYTLTVGEHIINNVLIGDVWLCSGQSNVDVTVERVYPQYADDIDAYSNDRIRLFRVNTVADRHGVRNDVAPTRWVNANKQEAWQFSALGYFLARRMYDDQGVPQGVICNSLGGTPIEAWLPGDTIRTHYADDWRRLQLWQDDDMVKAYADASRLANDNWNKVLNSSDPGVAGKWTDSAFDDTQWQVKNQYSDLVSTPNYIGSLWLRQHVNVDAAHAGMPARLLLGTLYDCDYTYVNGRQVGVTYYQYPPRRYDVPAGLLREGDNVITVRFVNKSGRPHFINEKPYKLIFSDGYTMPLSEQWRVSEGVRMPANPPGGTSIQNLPSVLYNGMLYPLAPYGLAGVVWYQGESNTGKPQGYAKKLAQLTGSWRDVFQRKDLPFVIVQLANFMQPSAQPQQSGWAELREEQRRYVESDSRSRLAVAIDLGETVDIHPLRKKEVAERVAKGMNQMVFGSKEKLSPVCLTAQQGPDGVVLTFDQALTPGAINEMELCGDDGRYVNATAQASGTTVTITAPGITKATRVRYAWKHNPITANLRGEKNQLPASPFEAVVKQ